MPWNRLNGMSFSIIRKSNFFFKYRALKTNLCSFYFIRFLFNCFILFLYEFRRIIFFFVSSKAKTKEFNRERKLEFYQLAAVIENRKIILVTAKIDGACHKTITNSSTEYEMTQFPCMHMYKPTYKIP